MKINSIQPSFTGYKNPIAINIDESAIQHTCINMQLTDDGSKELSEFRALKKYLPKEIENSIYDDIISINYLNFKQDKSSFPKIFINNIPLLSGEELKFNSNNLTTELSKDVYKNIENWHMKAYTFIAKLTRQMMNDNSNTINTSEIRKVVEQSIKALKQIGFDDQHSISLTMAAVLKKEPYQRTAGILNKKISLTMKNFFV